MFSALVYVHYDIFDSNWIFLTAITFKGDSLPENHGHFALAHLQFYYSSCFQCFHNYSWAA